MAISLEVMGSRMAENRRFYWMKLPNDYFRQLFQRKMRKQTGGIEMQLIYLKMLLYSIDKDAVIPFQGVYDSIEEELAEELGEESEMVKETINFLEANEKLEWTESGIFLPEALERVGSEGTSAERVRNFRRRKALQCNNDVTECNGSVTGSDASVQCCNVEKEIDIEKDKEVEKEKNGTGIFIILEDGTFYDVPLDKLTMWQQAYPDLDVKRELYQMASWCDANLSKRKSRRGVEKFINGWLNRSQKDGQQNSKKEEVKNNAAEPEAEYNPEDDPEHVPSANEVWERLRREGRL